jgi:hypothetical protein
MQHNAIFVFFNLGELLCNYIFPIHSHCTILVFYNLESFCVAKLFQIINIMVIFILEFVMFFTFFFSMVLFMFLLSTFCVFFLGHQFFALFFFAFFVFLIICLLMSRRGLTLFHHFGHFVSQVC